MYNVKNLLILLSIVFYSSGCQNLNINALKNDSSYTQAKDFFKDQSTAMQANAALSKDKQLWQQSHINILSYNTSLLLVGQTPSESDKSKISNIVNNVVPDHKKVYNQIEIMEPITFTQRAKDAWITTQLKSKLLANKYLLAQSVKIITENSTVYLLGKLTVEDQQTAVKIAQELNGVNKIVQIFDDLT